MRRLIPYVFLIAMAIAAQVTVSVAELTGAAMYGVYAGFCGIALLIITVVAVVGTWPSRGSHDGVAHSA